MVQLAFSHISPPVSHFSHFLYCFSETNQKFRSVKKQSHIVLLASVERAIWNWVEYHPEEFAEIQRNQNEELGK